ncbi:acetyl-CoA carboxylase biotin carboxylase subunit family protein [Streptacidiphilus sp. EB129]|uniref:ATP-grasp domain-containing protein n=1 Tax=Streptacidiphilus sp. EB129 TaxID=3156262 RepID=UPI00351900DA
MRSPRALVLRTEKPLFERARVRFRTEVDFIDLVESRSPVLGARAVRAFAPDGDTLAVVDSVMAHTPFSYAVATSEQDLAFGGFLRTRYGLPGLSYDQAVRATNKARMKQTLGDVLPTAAFWLAGDFLELAEHGPVPPRVVIKPLSGSAGRGVRMLETAEALRFLGTADSLYLVEEAVDVDCELHCDGVVRDGELRFVQPSVYSEPLLRTIGGNCASYHLAPGDRRREAAVAAARKLVGAVDATDFVFHLELFESGGELLFGEIGLRPAGGGVAESIGRFYGVNLWEEHLRTQIGLPSGLDAAPDPNTGTDPNSALDPNSGSRHRGVIGVSIHALRGRTLSDAQILELPGVVSVSPGSSKVRQAAKDGSTSAFTHLVFFDRESAAGARQTFTDLHALCTRREGRVRTW